MDRSYREYTKADWRFNGDNHSTHDVLKIGCLLRIADATELMAKRHQELIEERDRYKGWYDVVARDREAVNRSNAALRGVITRLKRQLAKAKGGA